MPGKWLSGDKLCPSGDNGRLSGDKAPPSGDKLLSTSKSIDLFTRCHGTHLKYCASVVTAQKSVIHPQIE